MKFETLTVNQIIAIVLAIAGVVMIYLALFMPPVGEISDSVLWALGQLLTTSGALLGVHTHYNSKINKIEEQIKSKDHENNDK